MKLSFEKKLNFTFLFAFIVLLNIIYFSFNNSNTKSFFWVNHTYQVLQKSDEIVLTSKNIQTALLENFTSQKVESKKFLDSLNNKLKITINELKEITKDNVKQQKNIDPLLTISGTISTYLKENVYILKAKRTPLISPNEKMIFINFDSLIKVIQQEENRLMIIRQQKNTATIAYINKRYILLMSLITALFIIVYIIIKKSQRNENIFNSNLLFGNQRIVNIIDSIADPFYILDLQQKFIYINSSAANKPGFYNQNLIGKTISTCANELNDVLLQIKIDEAALTKNAVSYQIYNAGLNTWYDKIIYPTAEGFTIYEKNITKRKLAENEFLKTKNLLEETNEIANIGGWEIDLATNVCNCTSVTRRILEVSTEHICDFETAVKFLKDGETRDRIIYVVKEAIENGTPFSEELQLITANGKERWVKIVGKPIIKDEKCSCLVGTFYDLTNEKKLKDALKLKEAEFTNAFKYSATGITLVSLEGYMTDVNESACKMIGYSKEELLKLNFSTITYPPDLSKNVELLQGALSGKYDFYNMEKRYVHKNGNILWASLNVSLIKDDEGKPISIISHITDITPKKIAEIKLQNSEQKFRELFQFLPAGIALLDLETSKYLEINNILLNISGYSKDEFVDHQSLERLKASYQPEDYKQLEKLMQTGHCGPYKKQATKKNGQIYSVLIEAIKFVDSNGKNLLLAVIQDISEIELKENQLTNLNNLLQKSNESLATINAEQAQFSYIVSHDLKEPLRMIVSFMDLLQKKYGLNLDEKANSYIDFAVDGGRRMQKMISDLLLYSSTGKNINGKEIIQLNEIINEVELNLYKQIKELHATIIIGCTNCPIPVYKSEILRLFQNLISNSIKFRKEEVNPIIEIFCTEEENHWLIEIKDNSIGIDGNNLDRIFDVFTRLHPINLYEGTGIGLAICKKIVTQHSGTIWVESVPGVGSSFYFTLSK